MICGPRYNETAYFIYDCFTFILGGLYGPWHDDFHDSTIGFQIFSCYYLDIECYSLLISHIPNSKIFVLTIFGFLYKHSLTYSSYKMSRLCCTDLNPSMSQGSDQLCMQSQNCATTISKMAAQNLLCYSNIMEIYIEHLHLIPAQVDAATQNNIGFGVGSVVVFGYSFLLASFVLFIVAEKESKVFRYIYICTYLHCLAT